MAAAKQDPQLSDRVGSPSWLLRCLPGRTLQAAPLSALELAVWETGEGDR